MAKREPLLNDFEQSEHSVAKIIKYFSDRLTKLRIENDSYDSPAGTRGRIAEIKEFQKLLEPEKGISTTKHVKTM